MKKTLNHRERRGNLRKSGSSGFNQTSRNAELFFCTKPLLFFAAFAALREQRQFSK